MKKMSEKFLFSVILFLVGISQIEAQSYELNEGETMLPPGVMSKEFAARTVPDQRVRRLITPKRILWQSEKGISKPERLLQVPLGQVAYTDMDKNCSMEKKGKEACGVLLDFGAQIQGGIELAAKTVKTTPQSVGKTVRVRVRFGESADEAMSEIGDKGSMSDHSARDMIINVPFLGTTEFGESSFRFARIDLIDEGSAIVFDSIRAVFTYRDLPWQGSFSCSDQKLNEIWRVGAHTLHLTMHHYIFEGAKRDRLVWYGDFNPQGMTTLYVFGAPKILRDTLGYLAREQWAHPKWMNGFPNYSLWWIVSVSDVYRYSGDLNYLKEQQSFLKQYLDRFETLIGSDGKVKFHQIFLDWPTESNEPAKKAGTQALMIIALTRAEEMARALNDQKMAEQARTLCERTKKLIPDHVGNKQAASLMALAGIEKKDSPNVAVVAKNGAEGFSTFYGYYMLEALGQGGQKQVALDVIRKYWGAMINVGATTFWEDFDLKWLEGSGRIDELTPPGKKSLHGDHGAYCYIGFRHSLCHGWATGPTPWLSKYVLGVTPLEPGFKKAKIQPFLGDLKWAEGTVPTPYGPIFVRHKKNTDGSIKTEVKAPKEIETVL